MATETMTVDYIRRSQEADRPDFDDDLMSPPERWYFQAVDVLLAEIDRLKTTLAAIQPIADEAIAEAMGDDDEE